MSDSSHAKRIWAGDHTVVEEARLRYEETEDLLAWASLLYSFRDTLPHCRLELTSLGSRILLEGREFAEKLRSSAMNQELADRADVFSTILRWLVPYVIHKDAGPGCYLLAREITSLGLLIADYTPGEHTPALLMTTWADLMMDAGAPRHEVLYHLLRARRLAPYIRDQNQRSRVWRRIGWGYWRLHHPMCLWYLARAIAVRGIPFAVRRKTLPF